MKGMIIYTSKYGATRQYAEWLGKELNLSPVRLDDIAWEQIERADYLVIGTPVYFGKFRIKDWLRKQVKKIGHKKLFFFVVNATAPGDKAARDRFVRDSVPGEIRQACEIYFLPGRVIYRKLSLAHKIMLRIGTALEKDPVKKRAMRTDIDEVKKENLEPLINAINRFRPAESRTLTKKFIP